MKKCDERNSHTISKLHMSPVSYNNDKNPAAKNFIPLHCLSTLDTSLFPIYTSPNFTSLQLSTLHFFPLKLHPTTLHSTSLHLSALHFFPFKTSPNYTSLHFTTLSCGLTPFQYPTAPFHLTSQHFTSFHFTALSDDFRHISIPFTSPRL